MARAGRGHLLDAGTYWLVEDSVAAASKASGVDPIRAERFDETGRIGAAIQSVDRFPAASFRHKRVVLEPADRSDPRYRPGNHVLSIAVGELSAQRWIRWPVRVHRPLPDGAVVKQVAVQRTRVGHRFRWEVLVTVSFEQRRETDGEARGVVGMDVGWRREGALLRVATHDGEDGCGVLCTDALEAFDYADAVRSVRDRAFDEAKTHARSVGLPGAEHAHLWRDKARLHRLALGHEELGTRWWRERDRHLEDIECGRRARAVRRRLDAYRAYADGLARRYRIVALEDMPMIGWVEGDQRYRDRQRAAAIGLLQQVIAERFGPERVDWVPTKNTTRTCPDCGEVRSEGVGPVVEWACEACGVVHHQDEGAARNIRASCERWIDDGNPPRARSRKIARKRPKRGDGVATGPSEGPLVVTAREPASQAAE